MVLTDYVQELRTLNFDDHAEVITHCCVLVRCTREEWYVPEYVVETTLPNCSFARTLVKSDRSCYKEEKRVVIALVLAEDGLIWEVHTLLHDVHELLDCFLREVVAQEVEVTQVLHIYLLLDVLLEVLWQATNNFLHILRVVNVTLLVVDVAEVVENTVLQLLRDFASLDELVNYRQLSLLLLCLLIHIF